MGKYLRTHKLPKPLHEKVDNIEFSSIKLQFKNHSKKHPRTGGFTIMFIK